MHTQEQLLAERAQYPDFQTYIEKCADIGTEPEVVKNTYSGNSCELPPLAVAVFETIKGLEIRLAQGDTDLYPLFTEGIRWFQRNYPDEYYTLLD